MKHGRRLGSGGAGWARRTWRGVRPDGNPLRRRWDRIEAFIFGSLLVAAAVGTPVAATAGGEWAHASAQQLAHFQRETSHQVRAVLEYVPSPPTTGGYSVATMVAAQAQWTTPSGALHTGQVPVPASSIKGEDITIWTDQAGDLTTPPMTPAQVADESTFGTVIAVVLSLVSLLVGAGVTRFLINRRRIAGWTADWRVTAPMWTRQR